MRHTVRFASGPEDVAVTTWGAASLDGLDELVTDLLSQERYLPGMTLLLDYSRLDWSALQPEDLLRRVHLALKDADLIGPARIAVVTSDPRLGDARVLRRDEPPWEAFDDAGAAQAWLESASARRPAA